MISLLIKIIDKINGKQHNIIASENCIKLRLAFFMVNYVNNPIIKQRKCQNAQRRKVLSC
jgi:hypothetical protein